MNFPMKVYAGCRGKNTPALPGRELLKKLEEFWRKVENIRQIAGKCIANMHIKMIQNVNISIDLLPAISYNKLSIL